MQSSLNFHTYDCFNERNAIGEAVEDGWAEHTDQRNSCNDELGLGGLATNEQNHLILREV